MAALPASAAPPAAAPPPSGVAEPAPEAEECGALGCRLFESPADALRHVLESKPLVLGVGEAHALKGTEGVESTTSRFTRELLPVLAPRASDIVIELMQPDRRCLKTTEEVRKEQKEVTRDQAASNQNEFVMLGARAKDAGVRPHILYPSCAQYDRIVKAGDDSIFVMLETIALLTEQKAEAILERNRKEGAADALLVLYGGAVHNDVSPREGRQAWSYGKSLLDTTGGRYVELDLIVREYIKDTDVWKSLPWYSHFDKTAHPDKVVLFHPAPSSYALIFPASG